MIIIYVYVHVHAIMQHDIDDGKYFVYFYTSISTHFDVKALISYPCITKDQIKFVYVAQIV